MSPSAKVCPDSVVSAVAVRRMKMTGEAQRTISSTAVGATASKSAAQMARWSGCSVKAHRPWLMALRVVSLPATTSRMKNEASSASVSDSPSTLALHERRGEVVGGVLEAVARPGPA